LVCGTQKSRALSTMLWQLLCALCLALGSTLPATSQKPNIVILVIDDVGWADVSYHGGDFPTPNLDALMRSGVELNRYYVQPVCSPTRSAIMSGRYPHKTGMQHFTTLTPGSFGHLPTQAEGTSTMAELLRDQGYATHAIGKWHLGYSTWEHTPTGRGFDTYTGYLQGAIDYYTHGISSSILIKSKKLPQIFGLDFWQNRSAFQGTNGTYSVDYYEGAHAKVLRDHDAAGEDAKPLFIYYAHESIHEPLQLPPPSRGAAEKCKAVNATKNRNTLCQMMSVLDSSVGQFVEDLKARNLWENTVMWVTSDNGGMTAFVDGGVSSASSNYPLRAGKTTLYEGGVRGVAFVTGGLVPEAARGSVRNDLMHAVDIVPTLAPLAGAKLPSNVDGIDMWEAITTGKAGGREELPVNINPDCAACIAGPNEARGLPLIPTYSALIKGDMKLILGTPGPLYDGWWSNGNYSWEHADKADAQAKVHLYNLTADESERHDLAEANPEVVAMMKERINFHQSKAQGFHAPQSNIPHLRALPQLHDDTWAPWVA